MTFFAALTSRHYDQHSALADHAHDASSMCVVIAGAYHESICGRTERYPAGTMSFYPAGEPHAQRFEARGARKLLLTPTQPTIDRIKAAVPQVAAPCVHDPDFVLIARRMEDELAERDAFSCAIVEGLSVELLARFERALVRCRPAQPSLALLAKAEEFIRENLSGRLSVAAIARAIDATPDGLVDLFRQHHGVTPGEYQRRLRLKGAVSLLSETAMPLSEIALACGFYDQAHFTRSFKALYGQAPSRFRAAR
ncbi:MULTISPECIES: helix-turn-helix domain-containing protein [Sphingomonas]|uniref:helix-turn-helix domain-containing protein n=1 Tax=Sphingomonas TaxID=13687 RepID=UPI00082C7783|nr:AraC family transcriptional regulator [Sphingomonas sp. CCH10-B3]